MEKSHDRDVKVLEKYGARRLELKKDEFIFYEGDDALYHFQVPTGSVKMVTNSSQGQEFIQGIFGANTSLVSLLVSDSNIPAVL